MRIWTAWLVALVVSVLVARLPPARAAGPAGPTVTGPIATTVAVGNAAHDYPFYASIGDLASKGYVEQEFFIQGTANRYETPADADGRILDGGHAYKTRIVVRRPKDAARFNGTVVLEWNNVTTGHDLDIDWFQSHDHFVRAGYAWIGVTPLPVVGSHG